MGHLFELVEGQRTVVEGGRQTETIFHKIRLSGTVTTIHSANLRHTDVALVNYHQVVVRKEIQQTVRTFASLSAVKIARIVLDARTVPQFFDHLHVVLNAFLDTPGLDVVAQLLEEGYLLYQIVLNVTDGDVCLFLCGHKQVGRVELVLFKDGHTLHCIGVQFLNTIYLVVPERHT